LEEEEEVFNVMRVEETHTYLGRTAGVGNT
jgi:hypothetical protein